jgi:hypothetical protein
MLHLWLTNEIEVFSAAFDLATVEAILGTTFQIYCVTSPDADGTSA